MKNYYKQFILNLYWLKNKLILANLIRLGIIQMLNQKVNYYILDKK